MSVPSGMASAPQSHLAQGVAPSQVADIQRLLQEHKGPDISVQLGNTLRGYSTSRAPVELAESIAGPASQLGFSLYSNSPPPPFSTGDDTKGIP